MNYLLDKYIYPFLPFALSDESKQSFARAGMWIVRMADWFCKTQDFWKFGANHPTFLAVELVYPLLCLMTLFHAYRHSGRYVYTWLAVLIFSITAQCFGQFASIPILDFQWKAQGVLTLLGGRIPLSSFIGVQLMALYIAYIFVQRMYLTLSAQCFATGLAFTLLKLPYLITGTKLLWWTWHDANPIVDDRFYGVPWSMLLFDLITSSLLVWTLEYGRKIIGLHQMFDWKKFVREFTCSFIAGYFTAFLGIIGIGLLIVFSKHFNIPFGIFTSFAAVYFILLIYIADRRNQNPEAFTGNAYWFDELSLAVCIHFIFLLSVSVVSQPANIISEGFHQPIGSCRSMNQFNSPIFATLKWSKFICLNKFRDENFDFHCIPGGKPAMFDGTDLLEWYAVCGTPSKNHLELVTILFLCSFAALIFLYEAAANSGKTPKIWRTVYAKGSQKKFK